MGEATTTLLHLLGIDGFATTSDDPQKVYEEYRKVEKTLKALKDVENGFKDRLKELAEHKGVLDEKGSYTYTLPNGRWFKKEARTTVSIDKDKVLELDSKKRFSFVKPRFEVTADRDKEGIVDELVEMISRAYDDEIVEIVRDQVICENEIEEAYEKGELTDEDMREIIKRSISYALTKAKE